MAKIARQNHGASCQVAGVQPGQLSGILTIPAIDLHAPVEEGTDDPELNVAVGARPAIGVARRRRGGGLPRARRQLLRAPRRAASRVTPITYATACDTVTFRGQRPAGRGGGVAGRHRRRSESRARHLLAPQRAASSPPTALVRATEVGARDQGQQPEPGCASSSRRWQSTDYMSSAPPALRAQGLTLEQNEAPMGTMSLVDASVAFASRLRRCRSRPPRSRPTSVASTRRAAPGRPGGTPLPGSGHAAAAGRGHRGRARQPARRRDRLVWGSPPGSSSRPR